VLVDFLDFVNRVWLYRIVRQVSAGLGLLGGGTVAIAVITSAVLAGLTLEAVLSHVTLFLTDLALNEWACVSSVLTGVAFLAAADLEFKVLCGTASSAALSIEKVSVSVLLDLGA
jgi:hypothetical protein